MNYWYFAGILACALLMLQAARMADYYRGLARKASLALGVASFVGMWACILLAALSSIDPSAC